MGINGHINGAVVSGTKPPYVSLMEKNMHFSYHQCQLGAPAGLQDKEAVAGGLRLVVELQTRTRQCCQEFQSAPPVQQGALLWLKVGRHISCQKKHKLTFLGKKKKILQFSQRAIPAAWSSLRPKAEMTFLLTSSWFFNGSKADMLAALTGVACFTVGSAATSLLSRPSPESADRDREQWWVNAAPSYCQVFTSYKFTGASQKSEFVPSSGQTLSWQQFNYLFKVTIFVCVHTGVCTCHFLTL